MKLYYAPGACSLSPHIAIEEAGLQVELIKVDLAGKKLADGSDYLAINPDGYVPMLELDDGRRLSEGPAIIQYIADQVPSKQLIPMFGSFERYTLQSTLNFIATELHKTCSPLFKPDTLAATRAAAIALFKRRLDHIERQLANGPWLMGNQFTIADGYLFTVLGWTPHLQIDLGPWPKIVDYLARVKARPAVIKAMQAEGLL